MNRSVSQSISPFVIYLLSIASCKEAGVNPNWLWAQGTVHPGQSANSWQGKHKIIIIYTPIYTYGQFK